MRTIGLVGGMSWESTVTYYRLINEAVRARMGGLHSAKCVLCSVDFAEVAVLQRDGRWEEATRLLLAAGQDLEKAGAECALICTNTMHKVAEAVQAGLRIPLLHIRIMNRLAEWGAEAIILGCTELGLLANEGDGPVPVFNTTRFHGLAAVDFAFPPGAAA